VREASLEQASQLGAEVYNAKEHERIDKALKKASGDGIRVGVDCVGMAATIKNAFAAVRRGGEVAVIGYTMEDVSFKAGAFMGLQKRIGGSWGCPTRLFPDVIALLEGGKIPLDVLVSKVYPLEKILDAFNDLHEGKVVGRAVVEIPS
jgi:Zn-dependent alcohol dehydrogenase